jgi:hypothetical protein
MMMERINEALADLKTALAQGEDLEGSLAEIAAEYGLPAHVLRNRAEKAFGDLGSLGERSAQQTEAMARQAQLALVRMVIAKIEREDPNAIISQKHLRELADASNYPGANDKLSPLAGHTNRFVLNLIKTALGWEGG